MTSCCCFAAAGASYWELRLLAKLLQAFALLLLQQLQHCVLPLTAAMRAATLSRCCVRVFFGCQALVEQQKRLKREKAKEVKRKPLKPNLKRPLSAFMRFSVSRRKELVAANPELRHPKCFKEIAQTISQDWKCLSAKKRAELEQEAAADFNKYKAKLKEWRATHAPKKRKKQRKSVTRTQSTPPAAAGDTCAAEAGDAAGDDSAAQVTGEDGDDKELQSEEKQRQSREAETANAATDVPESADDTRSSSRQSSRLEAPAAAAVADADASKDLKKAAAAEAACASTVA